MFEKKALVSLNTFALLILLYLAIFVSSYTFYSNSLKDSEIIINEKECMNSALSFRSNLIDTIKYPNSSLIYVNSYAKDDIYFNLTGNNIVVRQYLDDGIVEANVSSLGINFCNEYGFYETENIVISYNGSCILLTN